MQDLVGECSVTAINPTTFDNCSGEITATTNDALTYSNAGDYVINWIFDDGNGNISLATQNVVVTDNASPEAPELEDVVSECGVIVNIPTTTDNCAGIIYGETNDTLSYYTQGVYEIFWAFNDGNGNVSFTTQTVIIEDVTSPSINCISDINVISDSSSTYTVSGNILDLIDFSDNCEVASVSNDFNSLTTLNNAQFNIGTTTITWTVIDVAGNISNCSFDIIVEDYLDVINSNIDEAIAIYPNPSNGNFNVKYISSNNDNLELMLFDLTGKTIYSEEMVKKENVFNKELNFSNLKPSIYQLMIKSNGKTYLNKIVITEN